MNTHINLFGYNLISYWGENLKKDEKEFKKIVLFPQMIKCMHV